MVLTNFNEILEEICRQKAQIQKNKQYPYYLYISPDIMDIFCSKLPDEFVTLDTDEKIHSVDFFYGLEVVTIRNEHNYLEIKGINIPLE